MNPVTQQVDAIAQQDLQENTTLSGVTEEDFAGYRQDEHTAAKNIMAVIVGEMTGQDPRTLRAAYEDMKTADDFFGDNKAGASEFHAHVAEISRRFDSSKNTLGRRAILK